MDFYMLRDAGINVCATVGYLLIVFRSSLLLLIVGATYYQRDHERVFRAIGGAGDSANLDACIVHDHTVTSCTFFTGKCLQNCVPH